MVNGLHLYSAFIQSTVHLYSAFIQSTVHLYSAFIQSTVHLYSAFIQSAVQFMPLIHPFTHTLTHQRRLAATQGANQLVRSNRGLGVLLRDTSTRPGWDRTGNPPTARRQLLPPEPCRPHVYVKVPLMLEFWRDICCRQDDDFSQELHVFQQDNARPHSARVTTAWLRWDRPRVLDWPACSGNLPPIENV